jgi:ATP-dependent DNA helicase RecQ
LPTGSGKSLCFDLTAEILQDHGVTLVVSPLIALMADQTKLDRPGVTFFNSTLTPEETESRCESLRKGQYGLVYVTPERLGSDPYAYPSPVIRPAAGPRPSSATFTAPMCH